MGSPLSLGIARHEVIAAEGIPMRTFLRKTKKIVLLCGIICLSVAVSAQCKFTTLTIPGANVSGAAGVNDNGAIVGGFDDGTGDHGFLISGGKFFKFRFPGSRTTEANDINNFGQIVGDYVTGSAQHGFVVKNGAFQSISAPGPAGTLTRVQGINNVGDIVGSSEGSAAGLRGFLLHNGHFTFIVFPGSSRTDANGINGFGTIVGTYGDATGLNHGFMLKAGKFTTVDFPGADNTSVSRIDNEGDIVGNYEMHGDVHGFVLDKGRFVTLDDPNASMNTQISDVNSHDRIVGSFVDVTGHGHAFTATCPAGAVF